MRSEFPSAPYTVEPDGSWCVTVRERGQAKRAAAMLSGVRAIERERGAEIQAEQSREAVVVGGRRIDYPDHLIDSIKDRDGVHAVCRPGGRVIVSGRCLPDGSMETRTLRPDGSWDVTVETREERAARPASPVW